MYTFGLPSVITSPLSRECQQAFSASDFGWKTATNAVAHAFATKVAFTSLMKVQRHKRGSCWRREAARSNAPAEKFEALPELEAFLVVGKRRPVRLLAKPLRFSGRAGRHLRSTWNLGTRCPNTGSAPEAWAS